ncbi:hypothetical protein IC784_03100 [Acinetobacter seifertii]|uniref:Uncharacterized protein n=1 Tax=Acinetobacter seifertii TaxID=1530123 RepID=A0A7H2YXG0_9GAMM|nr:hypothetical protein IC795_02970 [Acinetobacter seifertii]QNX49370.1 hypothetical protein IC784_03100 [Acinetobacter seifertii]QNY17794.1 hypothetical protein IC765_03170 [Acinetobacter seifertii]
MKMTAKIALFSAAIVTMGSLAACQSMNQPPKPEHGMMQDGHHRMKHREFTPEQKAAWEQHRAERQARFEQIQKACEGKANGQAVNVQVGDRTLEGTCNLRFEPKRPQPPVNAPTPAAVQAK